MIILAIVNAPASNTFMRHIGFRIRRFRATLSWRAESTVAAMASVTCLSFPPVVFSIGKDGRGCPNLIQR